MNSKQRELWARVRIIFREHGYSLRALENGRAMVYGFGPFNGHDRREFSSLCSAVDWAKPIFKDERLYPLYV